MPKPDHREKRRKRRAHARQASARIFERPIQAALEQRAIAHHEVLLDRLHDKSRATVLIPTAGTSRPQPAPVQVAAPLKPAPEPLQNVVRDSSADPKTVSADTAAPEPTAPNAETALPATNPPQRTGFLDLLRKFRESLFLPVLLAILAIGLSNRLPSLNPPGSHLATTPAVGTSSPPAETPQASSVAAVPADTVASAAPAPSLAAVPPTEMIAVLSMPPARAPDSVAIAARETDFLPRMRACTVGEIAAFKPGEAPVEASAFGVALALAAEAQINDFVVYNDDYYNLRYPGGDVPALYGVCSDVVIRAYRALGVDLQRLVHEARVGSGDTSIDHRRTETLRRFFARHGTKLPVTDFADDYRPGDIVSYERPQNRGAQVHIAIVSNQMGPSGHLMIVHNRGWGPQIEDALFVDHITGHYRMTGQPKLLTSWGINKSHGPGLNSWSTLVRRAAIVRGSGRAPKAKSNPKL